MTTTTDTDAPAADRDRPEPLWWTQRQLAAALQITTRQVQRLAALGAAGDPAGLPPGCAVGAGRGLRYRVAVVRRWAAGELAAGPPRKGRAG